MPTASDPRLVVRLSPEMYGRLVAVAGERGKAAFVRGALEAALGDSKPSQGESPKTVGVSSASPQAPDVVEATRVVERGDGPLFKCPGGHSFVSESAGARCFCNRRVVPA